MSQQEQSEGLYRPKLKEGTHLASSQDTHGTYRGILQDDNTNKLVGHAEWERVDESELGSDCSYDYQENQQKVGWLEVAEGVITLGGMYILLEQEVPSVKHWRQNIVVPTIKKTWKSFTDIFANKRKDKPSPKDKKKSDLHTNDIVTADKIVQDMFSQKPEEALEEAYEKYMNDMTSEEAQRELIDIFILSAQLTAKIRKLSNARIIGNGDAPTKYLEGQKILDRLATPEYIDGINQILESNPQLLEEKIAGFSGILGRNLVLNGQYVPIEVGKFKEAMILQSASE